MSSFTDEVRRRGYVRPTQDARVTGTCAALAAGSGIRLRTVRVLMILAFLVTGGWIVVPYLAAALLLPADAAAPGSGYVPATPGAPSETM